eukprot:276027-Pyramimonas_sp.AAC.1
MDSNRFANFQASDTTHGIVGSSAFQMREPDADVDTTRVQSLNLGLWTLRCHAKFWTDSDRCFCKLSLCGDSHTLDV